MSLIQYCEAEQIDKEETIENYKDLFQDYENNVPALSDALNQLFISSGANQQKTNELIKDILDKCKRTIDGKINEIIDKYKEININDAYIICSYTCEALENQYSPYKILNQNLVEEDRKKGVRNISKYLFIFLKSLRKLPIYYPQQYLYRCLRNKVSLVKDPNNEKWVPYAAGNQKTFWGFTSTSPNIKTSFNFLKGENIKFGTIFSIGGDIWGYDISIFNYFKEEEILLEPERKYLIDVVYSVNNVTNVFCKIIKTPLILDNNNYSDKINNAIKDGNNNILNDYKINSCLTKIEMEITINNNYKYISGMGFLCNIPSKKMKALITYNNIIDEEFLNNQKKLIIFIQNKKIEINLEISRYKNIISNFGITLIEILDLDQVNNFIEIDDFINSKNYNEEEITYVKFDINNKNEYLKDKIVKYNNNYILNSIKDLSEGIILLNYNSKIIGISQKNIIPINKLINQINFIKGVYEIKKEDLGKEIQILNNGIEFNKEFIKTNEGIEKKIKIIINGEIKTDILKYKFKKEGRYIMYYIVNDTLYNMSGLFCNCSSLKEINFSSLNANDIFKTMGMFCNCSSLEKLDLSSFNTEKVDNFIVMFYNCSSLKELNLSSFKTHNIKNLRFMFSNCISLQNIN